MKSKLHSCRTLLLVIIVSAAAGCHKGTTGTPISNIGILAAQNDSVFTWRNGVTDILFTQPNVLFSIGPNAIAINNMSTYVAAWQPKALTQLYAFSPADYLNGSMSPLVDSNGTVGFGMATAVALSGSDVYFAGTRDYDPSFSTTPYTTDNAAYPIGGAVATVWKNGTPTTLPSFSVVGLVNQETDGSNTRNDYVTGLCVSGSNVYVAGGSYYTLQHAAYWSNGVLTNLNGNLVYPTANGNFGYPTTTGIAVSGSDVYVSGYQITSTVEPLALYWKNGAPVFLSKDSADGSSASAIAVSGSDVYVAGFQNIGNNARATVWKNGVATLLTSGSTSSIAMGIAVVGSDVYVAGYNWAVGNHYVACYWKNGTLVNITDGSSNAIAYAISVE